MDPFETSKPAPETVRVLSLTADAPSEYVRSRDRLFALLPPFFATFFMLGIVVIIVAATFLSLHFSTSMGAR